MIINFYVNHAKSVLKILVVLINYNFSSKIIKYKIFGILQFHMAGLQIKFEKSKSKKTKTLAINNLNSLKIPRRDLGDSERFLCLGQGSLRK